MTQVDPFSLRGRAWRHLIVFAIVVVAAALCRALDLGPGWIVPIAAALFVAWRISRMPREKQLDASIFAVLVAMCLAVLWVLVTY